MISIAALCYFVAIFFAFIGALILKINWGSATLESYSNRTLGCVSTFSGILFALIGYFKS
jgi:hypothetical protein